MSPHISTEKNIHDLKYGFGCIHKRGRIGMGALMSFVNLYRKLQAHHLI